MVMMPILINRRVKLDLRPCGVQKTNKYSAGFQYESSRDCLSPSAGHKYITENHYSFYNSRGRFSHSEIPERNYTKEHLKATNTYEVPAPSIEKAAYIHRYNQEVDTASKRPVTADYK